MAAKRPSRSKKPDAAASVRIPSWVGLLGLSETLATFASLQMKDGLAQVILLSGRHGLGKSSLALGLAALAYCDQARSCGECPSCRLVLANRHPEMLVVDTEASSLKLEDIGPLQAHIALLPDKRNWPASWQSGIYAHLPRMRTIVLCDAERLTVQSMNRLLKTLEEPPASCRFILSSSRPESLLPTIRSRCFTWQLQPPKTALTLAWLETQVKASPELSLETALRFAGQAPGRALSLLQGAESGLGNLLRLMQILLQPPSLPAALDAAQVIGKLDGITPLHIAEAAELVLNQYYRSELMSLARSAPEVPMSRCRVWRQILSELRRVPGNGRVPLAKQVLAEALALA